MSQYIEEKDVTAVNLAVELERAVIEHRLDDDKSIYVNEDNWFPFWITVLPSAGLVSFKTHCNFKRASSTLQRLEFCNELNKHNYLITAYVLDDRLMFDYALNFREGLLRETFIRSCRQFSSNIDRGLNKTGVSSDLVLSPGKTEPEDESEA